jgi:beta-aspartyl-peptidase (threonine type)
MIIVHGGAGRVPEEEVGVRLEGCRKAVLEGWRSLEQGGSALDAVEAAVALLEDDPLFNAGRGACLNALGEVELDASIMDGSTLAAGAVAAVKRVQNPIVLARKILEEGRHVLLAGEGARRFAKEVGIPECSERELVVERQRQRFQETHGTVGAVALDMKGRVAAATSTGGLFGKRPGRVGDSALIGCGTYADSFGGASCTGVGEAIIKTVLAKVAVDLLRDGLHPMEAAKQAIGVLEEKARGEGGLILLDHLGRVGYARNTPTLLVALTEPASGEVIATA